MLTHLRIKNLALVADLTLELGSGFNAITGETGAGKSILIGALNLLLGQRADRTLLRAGADSCSVEGVVEVSRVKAPLATFLAENGLEPCEGGELLLKRVFTATGTNRQFINGSPTSLQILADLGEWLVDIHGPHDHQSLFQTARQLDLLDAHAGLVDAREAFGRVFDRLTELEAAKTALVVDDRTYAQQLDLLRHQVSEIAAARLQPGEEESVSEEHRRAENAARLLENAHGALELLAEGDDTLTTRVGHVGRLLQDLARLDAGAAELLATHERAVEQLRELQSGLTHYVDRVDLDPGRMRELEDRLNLIQSLRRKYGGTVDAVVAFGEEARQKLQQLEGRDAELARLNADLQVAETELRRLGAVLTASRRQAIPKLAKAVMAQLRDLGFKQSEFNITLQPSTSSQRSGLDVAEFVFAPNPGEPARPLRAIASSGELARVMLALKTVLAAQDDIPVLVFDEVDANVGGETAHAVGQKMQQIGRRRQVLCITHLAPVAASADHHVVVTKTGKEGRTVTEIAAVENTHRVAELARMLGGGEAARLHAEALLQGRSR
jgi:DNA repair protein RecN (Recombination protein N)